MLKKGDRDSDGGPIPTDNMNTIENIFRQNFKVDNSIKHGYVVEELIQRLCDNCDYMKGILCMLIALEMLKPNGFKIYMKEEQQKGNQKYAYFSKASDRVTLFASENIDNMYMALIDQLIYKVFITISLSGSEKRNIMNILDTVKETTRAFYEELTQREIKMLEWLDIKLVNLLDKLSYSDDEYFTDLEYMDESVINLVGVCLMWGRNLERLEVVSKILNPLMEYIQNTILPKIENFVIRNETFNRIQISDYFKVKLNTIKLLNEEGISYAKKFNILKDIRLLDVPIQTEKTLDEFKLHMGEIENIGDIYKEFERERSIYRYSVLQRSDELNYIEKKKKELSKHRRNNAETLMQLSNLKNIIENEERDLEESLKIINKKINILKGAGV